ncbi:uncharacterized protein BO97DRAFT_416011 [Aspergillus homomorphus CBS 101889]|uniref:Uncharacterized protein n=1 Tax=Aspergillus homomorphus (strain CBS 101889) TaxID=1450537 RepID=A0A395HR97_ASPHC|nr:hypothetical protein BO97DRAFT_416011 [Aspergillus homomorphus CBS 101889]RAL10482.1 hypothetical protein BO97DRAFT_416011 [Aspergillus homomorphus CBS 101889]
MDPFSTLPYELLSSISEEAADWAGLDSLIQVSPRIAALFTPEEGLDQAHPDAINLVENILRTNPVMSYQLHQFFRICADLRRPSFSSGCNLTLAEFMAQDYLSPLSPTSITGTILRDMVRVAANIQRLACACLTTFLARVRAVQPRSYGRDTAGKLKGGEPYPQREAGPPSWVEEYRVYRALWHLQLYSDVWNVSLQLDWPINELHLYLRTSGFPVPTEKPKKGVIRGGEPTGDEMRAVSECLQDICTHPNLSDPLVAAADTFYLRFWLELPNALSLGRHDSLICDFRAWSPPPLPPSEEDTCKPVAGLWANTISATEGRNLPGSSGPNRRGAAADFVDNGFGIVIDHVDTHDILECNDGNTTVNTISQLQIEVLPTEDANYSRLCSFTCNYGYCSEGACATVSSPLTIPSTSPFTPFACVAGTGEDDLEGLCSYSCNFGYCPIHSGTCTTEGVLVDAPAANSSLTGVPVSTVVYNQYHGLCDFACSRGYCPDSACELRSTVDSSTGSTGHNSSSSSSASNVSNDTTIDLPPSRLTLRYLNQVQVTGWEFSAVVISGSTDSQVTVHPTPRLPPSTVIITDDPNPLDQSSVTHTPRTRTVIIPPYPWDTRAYGKDSSDDDLIVPKPPTITVADSPACSGIRFIYSDIDTDDDNNTGSTTDNEDSGPDKGFNSNENPDNDNNDDEDNNSRIDFRLGGININGNSPDPNTNNEDSNKSQTSKATSTSTCTRQTFTDTWISCTSLSSTSTSCTTTSTLVEISCSVTATTMTTIVTGDSCPFIIPNNDQGSEGGPLADSAWSSITDYSSGWYTYLGYTADPAKTASTTTARKTSTSTTTTTTTTAAALISTNTKLLTYSKKSSKALFLREEVGNNKHTYIY